MRIGTRPIDLHLKAFEQLGATVSLESGDVIARAPKGRLVGAEIEFEKVTVTGTENVMMAASLAKARTMIRNAAMEPEIEDLAELLNKMGARIQGCRNAGHRDRRRRASRRCRAYDHSRPHRDRDIRRCGGDNQRRARDKRL